LGEMKGDPVAVKPSKPALDAELRQRLWSECERLTGVHYKHLGCDLCGRFAAHCE